MDILVVLWPIGIMAGAFFLLAAHATKSLKRDDYMDESYQWAMRGGLILLATTILISILAFIGRH
jgi:hypothetical protein